MCMAANNSKDHRRCCCNVALFDCHLCLCIYIYIYKDRGNLYLVHIKKKYITCTHVLPMEWNGMEPMSYLSLCIYIYTLIFSLSRYSHTCMSYF